METLTITEHAFERAKERLSLSKYSLERLAYRAYYDGITHSEAKSKLQKYITKLWADYKTANNIRIYGENVFLFHDKVLITLYQVPFELRKFIKISK